MCLPIFHHSVNRTPVNPNENRVGRVQEGMPKDGNTLFKNVTIADSVGVRVLAEGGLGKIAKANASLMVNLQAGEGGDTWLGTTVEGGLGIGNKLVNLGGAAWGGIRADMAADKMELKPDYGASSSGAQFGLGELAMVGFDLRVSWMPKPQQPTQTPNQPTVSPSSIISLTSTGVSSGRK